MRQKIARGKSRLARRIAPRSVVRQHAARPHDKRAVGQKRDADDLPALSDTAVLHDADAHRFQCDPEKGKRRLRASRRFRGKARRQRFPLVNTDRQRVIRSILKCDKARQREFDRRVLWQNDRLRKRVDASAIAAVRKQNQEQCGGARDPSYRFFQNACASHVVFLVLLSARAPRLMRALQSQCARLQ